MATYGSTAGVQALVPSVTIGASSNPNTTQVTNWLAEGYSIINRHIARAGYTTPVDNDPPIAATDELAALNNLYAAAYALRARGIDSASGDGEERSEVWLADFWARLKDFVTSNLVLLGLVALPAATTSRPRRVRTIQGRRIDGYARGSTDETWAVSQGEYTGPTTPSE